MVALTILTLIIKAYAQIEWFSWLKHFNVASLSFAASLLAVMVIYLSYLWIHKRGSVGST